MAEKLLKTCMAAKTFHGIEWIKMHRQKFAIKSLVKRTVSAWIVSSKYHEEVDLSHIAALFLAQH